MKNMFSCSVLKALEVYMSCIFCEYMNSRNYLMENELAFAIYDQYPVNKGHILVIPKRHYASYFDVTPDEIMAFYDLIKKVKELLDGELRPDGYIVEANNSLITFNYQCPKHHKYIIIISVPN